eukprot:Gb_33706 [translate_table: standard]
MAAIIRVTQGNRYNWSTFGLPKTPKLLAWTGVYRCERISEENVEILRAQLQLAVEIITAQVGDIEKLEAIGTSATTQSHGQRSELRQVEDVEDRRRKKGKFKVDENTPGHSLEHPLQPSIEHGATTGAYQYEERWKIFEDGLEKKDCELFNHEQWRPTFTANVIDILVRDLVCKIKVPEYGESSETKNTKNKATTAEQKIQFIQKFCDLWLSNITLDDIAYQQFKCNYSTKIPDGLESIILKLGTWILKHDHAQNKIYELKSKVAEATCFAWKAGQEADVAHAQMHSTIGESNGWAVRTRWQPIKYANLTTVKVSEAVNSNAINESTQIGNCNIASPRLIPTPFYELTLQLCIINDAPRSIVLCNLCIIHESTCRCVGGENGKLERDFETPKILDVKYSEPEEDELFQERLNCDCYPLDNVVKHSSIMVSS